MVKNPPASAGDTRDAGSVPELGRFPLSGKRKPTQVFLPGKFHGQRSLVGYSPWNHKRVRHDFAITTITIIKPVPIC